jgi:Flp pilus assembly protein TadG
MRTRLDRTKLARPSARPRAVGFIWFFTVAIYFLLLSAFFSVDVSKVMIAQNQAQLVAESSALAAAAVITPNAQYYSIDPINAPIVAQETFRAQLGAGAMPEASNISIGPPIIGSTGGIATVTVNVTYSVGNLIFAAYFGVHQAPTYTASSTAFLCVPTQHTNPTGGYCVPPTN